MCIVITTLVIVAALSATASSARAQERRMGAGVSLNLAAANGEPANDIPGAGVLAHYTLNDEWTLAAAVERSEYDYEEPAKIVGIAQDPALEPIDARVEATTLRVWIERSISDRTQSMRFFAGAGLGAAFTDAPDVAGLSANGEPFDIRTEVDTEILGAIIAGVRRRFGERWYGEAALRLEQHFAGWRSMDRISGAQGTIDDYVTWGGHIAFGLQW